MIIACCPAGVALLLVVVRLEIMPVPLRHSRGVGLLHQAGFGRQVFGALLYAARRRRRRRRGRGADSCCLGLRGLDLRWV